MLRKIVLMNFILKTNVTLKFHLRDKKGIRVVAEDNNPILACCVTVTGCTRWKKVELEMAILGQKCRFIAIQE